MRRPGPAVRHATRAAALLFGAALVAAGAAHAQLVPELKLRIPGLGAGHNFGASVGRAGDVNGDGYEDFLVGAPKAPGLRSEAGRAYVLLGGADLDSIPDLTMIGRYSTGHFGSQVVGIGDFNGDGYDDWVVGDPQYNLGVTPGTYGRAWIYYGSAQLGAAPRFSLDSPAGIYAFGSAVAALGDVNGDGYPDFAVSGSVLPTNPGTVSIYFGGLNADNYPDFTLQTGTGNSVWAIAGPGDINGDGYNDMVVGIHGASATVPGSIEIFYGGPAMSDAPARQIFSNTNADLFGYSVAGAGDVNGDGYADWLVGAPFAAANGLPGAGRVLLFYGGRPLSTSPAREFHGQGANDNFGASVAGAGDLDGDGFADIAVGASSSDINGINSGRAYVFFGGAPPDTIPAAVLNGEAANDNLGVSVANAGDPDLGGTNALLVGALLNDAGGVNAGAAYLLRIERYHIEAPLAGDHWSAGGSADVKWQGADPADIELSLDGGASWTTLASGVGGATDNQVTIAVPDQVTGRARLRLARTGFPPLAGNATLCSGFFHLTRELPAPAAVFDLARIAGPSGAPRLGRSVATGVDWDGDGRPDVFAGASPDPGGAVIVTRELDASDSTSIAIHGLAPNEDFGAAIADIGDYDGDGRPDLAIGAPSYDGAHVDQGRVYVYRGGPGADHSSPITIDASGTGELFGSAIAAADLNGDGRPDLIVGAPGSSGPGHVYVFIGGRGSTIPDAVLDAGTPGPFGAAVARAGDINGDGFDDLLVSGPPLPSGRGASTVHVFFGAANVLQMHRTVLEGTAIGDGFGSALAPLGDFDGDGFDDFAVGAPLSNDGGPDAGEVRVYFGAPGRLPQLGSSLTGNHAGDQFGSALAGGADLNGDGRPDLVIGSPAASDAGPQCGRIDVLYGRSDSHLDLFAVGRPRTYLGSSLAARSVGADSLLALVVAGAPLGAVPSDESAGAVQWFPVARWRFENLVAGTRWPLGSTQRVQWSGAEPADLWFEGVNGEPPVRLASGAGGAAENSLDVKVTQALPDSGFLVLRSLAGGAIGRAAGEPIVQVERAVSLASFSFDATPNGVRLNFATAPPIGPQGISGVRVRRIRAGSSGPGEIVGPNPLTTTSFTDPDGLAGDTYVVYAINGLGEEIEAGRLTLPAAPAGVRVWPQPGGENGVVTVQFAAPRGANGQIAPDLVGDLFDAHGRWVTAIVRGVPETRAGIVTVQWNGSDAHGNRAGPGVYFLRVHAPSVGYSVTRRVVMLDTPVH